METNAHKNWGFNYINASNGNGESRRPSFETVEAAYLKLHCGASCNPSERNSGSAVCGFESHYSRGRCWPKERWLFKGWQPEKMVDSHPEDHVDISVQAGVLLGGRGKAEQRNQGEWGWKFSTHKSVNTVHSNDYLETGKVEVRFSWLKVS